MDTKARSIPGLLTDVLHGTTRLLRGELALARAEAEEKLRSIASVAILFLIAGVVLLVSLNVLAGATVAALTAQGIAPGGSALIVAGGLVFIGGILIVIGRQTFSSHQPLPRRTAVNIRRDAQIFKEAMAHDTSF